VVDPAGFIFIGYRNNIRGASGAQLGQFETAPEMENMGRSWGDHWDTSWDSYGFIEEKTISNIRHTQNVHIFDIWFTLCLYDIVYVPWSSCVVYAPVCRSFFVVASACQLRVCSMVYKRKTRKWRKGILLGLSRSREGPEKKKKNNHKVDGRSLGHIHPIEVLDAPVLSLPFFSEVGVRLQMARAPCSGFR
jgi:hypothetical protein